MADGEIPSARSRRASMLYGICTAKVVFVTAFDQVDLAVVVSSKEPSQRYAQRVKRPAVNWRTGYATALRGTPAAWAGGWPVVRGFRAKAAKTSRLCGRVAVVAVAECGNNDNSNVGPAGSEDLGPGGRQRGAHKQSNAARARGRLARGCCTQIGQEAAGAPLAHRRWMSRVAEAFQESTKSMMMEADDEDSREWVTWTLERCSMG